MKKRKRTQHFPVSQRSLAAYLRIGASLLNMIQSRRHGPRQLNASSSKKWNDLVLAHNDSKKTKPQSASVKMIEAQSSDDCTRFAKRMLQEANYTDSYVTIIERRLKEMIAKEQEDLYWLNTVDHLLETLPRNKEAAKDRVWLNHQQVIVLERLKKNGWLAQSKLETKIEMGKARARVYRDVQKKLLKR